ncbi:MAG TPA: neutral/alkaline non-lysosomal ceramidase N-terminal domain-containing protein [Bryobacteraceae bacterium]|nr:neutral/alkaline non-lysosomal ceramidase N-terminal domain-containing protein [Bryobacteraceae bacterium]
MQNRVLFLLALVSLPATAQLRVGRAAVDITPPVGVPMAGYYYVRVSEGVHDPLHAKALVLEENGVKAAMVALDLVGIPRKFVDAAREQIGKTTGVPPANVMISATHSHTGPEMGGRLLGVQPATKKLADEYLNGLPARIAESVRKAEADLQPARVLVATGREDSVSFVRRYYMKDGTVGWNPGKRNPNVVRPVGGIDPEIPIAVFETPEGKPLAVYINFACHQDTTGGMLFSADYAYTISRLLSEVKGADVMTLFTIGAAGNINHLDVNNPGPQSSPAEAERIGVILTGDILKAWPHLKEIDPGTLKVSHEAVTLPLAEYKSGDVEKARGIVARYGVKNADPFYTRVNAFKILELDERHGEPIHAEVQVISLGNQLAWVGMPGEIFVDLGKEVKVASPFPHTILAALANGAIGYIPDRAAYPQGAYEVVASRVAPGGGERMVDSAIRQLIALRGSYGSEISFH